MPRKPTPDGRRVHENVRLSEAEASLLDSVRGDVKRGPWMRQKAIEAARQIKDSRIPENLGIKTAAGPGQPSGTVSAGTGRDGEVTADEAHTVNAGTDEYEPGPCVHRIPPGSYCTRCGRLI